MTTLRETAVVRGILSAFASRTGLVGGTLPPRRYLWTDSFAVCTFLALHRAEGGNEWLDCALRLVQQVHDTLGRHRPDDPRHGWLSGLPEGEAAEHPTRGGLRIGKPLPERGLLEPFDESLEWERDGQYFHYLTQWIHALTRVAASTSDERYLRWAIELAEAAHTAFVHSPPGSGAKQLAWKMSIDLRRAQVPSMGAQDPLDGLLTFRGLRADARRKGWEKATASLARPVGDMRSMCSGVDWTTADPLGTGALLCDAQRLALLLRSEPDDASLLPDLVDCAVAGLGAFVRSGTLHRPASERLAFRELGLTIGLHAVSRLPGILGPGEPARRLLPGLEHGLTHLRRFLPLATTLEAFWLHPAHQQVDSWLAHLDINSVMLATALMPEGYLAP